MKIFWKLMVVLAVLAAAGVAVWLWMRSKKTCCVCGAEDCCCDEEFCFCEDDLVVDEAPVDDTEM